jgi:phage gpG-like protein
VIGIAIDSKRAKVRLASLAPNIAAKVSDVVSRNAAAFLAAAQAQLPGGKLADSLRAGVQVMSDGATARIASDGSVPYARIEEYGGRIEMPEIAPRAAKVLAFPFHGKLVFAAHTKAHNADIPARPYMQPALGEIAPQFRADLAAAVSEV